MIQCPVCNRPMSLSDDGRFYECGCTRIDARYVPEPGQEVRRHADCCGSNLVFTGFLGCGRFEFSCACGAKRILHA